MCHDPPVLVFSINNKGPGVEKDTLVNIRENGECVINIISSSFVEAANHTCGNFDPLTSEMEVSGLDPVASDLVTPPRVGQSAIQFECKVANLHPLHASGETESALTQKSVVVFCEIVKVHVKEDVYDSESGTVRLEALDPISRLGDISYGRNRDWFCIPRPKI